MVSIKPNAKTIDELSELKNYRIGHPIGTIYDELIQTDLEPSGHYAMSQIRHYSDYSQVLKDMQSGNLDLSFMDKLTLRLWQNWHGNSVKSVFKFPQEDPWGFAFGRRSPLKNEFDAFLKELGPNGIEDIINSALRKQGQN